jgi:hypothetical protein
MTARTGMTGRSSASAADSVALERLQDRKRSIERQLRELDRQLHDHVGSELGTARSSVRERERERERERIFLWCARKGWGSVQSSRYISVLRSVETGLLL